MNKHGTILPRAYFNRPALQVARGLLGKYLLRCTETGLLAGRIVEVEAYVGPEDLACHASKGRTKRTDVLFGPPGIAYVYLIYGMYHCFNVVTERDGYPAAVLVRGIELDRPTANMMATASNAVPMLIDGPGRLCRVLQIDLNLNRWDLTKGQMLWLEDRKERVSPSQMTASPRIGVDYAGEWAAKPWRFRIPPRFTAASPPRRSTRTRISR
ncbi:MAG TPA: DNA-3-methyladenine glycosylase [Nitrospiraceae bacterium]|nr:DNA-3-methyladenine glycosylase [Nitrospiraceae bacterium]